MARVGKHPLDEQQLEGGVGGGMSSGIRGTKWSSMPSFKGSSSLSGDLKKLRSDTSQLKGGALAASDEAKGRAAKRIAARAAGATALSEGTRAALDSSKKSAPMTEDESNAEVERSLREADAEMEGSKYGKGDKMKSGGSVKGWGKARGARKAKIY